MAGTRGATQRRRRKEKKREVIERPHPDIYMGPETCHVTSPALFTAGTSQTAQRSIGGRAKQVTLLAKEVTHKGITMNREVKHLVLNAAVGSYDQSSSFRPPVAE